MSLYTHERHAPEARATKFRGAGLINCAHSATIMYSVRVVASTGARPSSHASAMAASASAVAALDLSCTR